MTSIMILHNSRFHEQIIEGQTQEPCEGSSPWRNSSFSQQPAALEITFSRRAMMIFDWDLHLS